jgi:hypothetical protein
MKGQYTDVVQAIFDKLEEHDKLLKLILKLVELERKVPPMRGCPFEKEHKPNIVCRTCGHLTIDPKNYD